MPPVDPWSFGLSVADSALSFGSNFLQNHYNKEMAQYQNDWNLDMWHRQNEYNSPKATMNRLVEAGINPRAYQQIGQFANAGAPQAAAPQSKISELSAFQSVARQGLENELLKEQLKQAKEDTRLKMFLGGKHHSDSQLTKLKYIITALTNGLDPKDIGVGMIQNYTSDGNVPMYKKSDLYRYIQDGTTAHPFLRKGELGNLLQAAGVDLRNFEGQLKDLELKDYEKYGIRGNSDWVNLGRALGVLLRQFLNQ